MPEMPEVETVVRGLQPKLIGRYITEAKGIVNKDNVIIYPAKELFIKNIVNKKIEAINRKGKYIIFQLSEDYKLIIHLRMTGKLINFKAEDKHKAIWDKINKFACVEFSLDNHSQLIYSDVRRFGTLYLVKENEIPVVKGLCNLGPEPLSADFTVEYLKSAIKNRQIPIKNFLLDQTKIAGLGNIYVDEALAIAKINPQRKAASLKKQEITNLFKAINQVIQQGILDGGTSFRDYRNADNQKGSHQENLLVFQRTNQPCKICGTPIVKIKLGGRGTHFCPKCQPMK